MVAIEHNPTHVENPEEKLHLEGITQNKNRKNGALGVFAKMLAGLVSKKTVKAGAENLKAEAGKETAEAGAINAAFFNLMEGKVQKKLKDGFAADGLLRTEGSSAEALLSRTKKAVRQKEASSDQLLAGIEQLALERERLFQMIMDEAQGESEAFAAEKVSLETDFSGKVEDAGAREVPFQNGEGAEQEAQAEMRNVLFKTESADKEESWQIEAAAKKAAKKKSAALEVHDLRTQTSSEAGIIAEQGLKGVEEIRNSAETEIVVELRPTGERGSYAAEAEQTMTAGERFDQMLARELRGELSADIVRQAAIVLRDGGEGTIRLSLRPETLGKVKIQLEMAENRISGLIFVENEEALRAFEQEIHTLEQSFRDSGFEASLSAALDYRDGGQRQQEKMVQPFFSARFTAASYEESSAVESGGYGAGFGNSVVNVFA